jgi:tRNA threonylcarbamoyladenosine biosynthesis protein TsaB
MILAIDTSTAACTAALFDSAGRCISRRDEVIGRGHAERLAPMLAELLEGRKADTILVGVGPGSFTGIRVGIAAAHGLAIGWDAALFGMSSLALLAASADGQGELAAAMIRRAWRAVRPAVRLCAVPDDRSILNLAPAAAAAAVTAEKIAGPGAQALIEARGRGEAIDAWPAACNALRLPEALRSLTPEPVYARAPDAKVRSAV